jgi:hypothetical protein
MLVVVVEVVSPYPGPGGAASPCGTGGKGGSGPKLSLQIMEQLIQAVVVVAEL